MSKSLSEQIADLKNAIDAQATMRPILGEAVVDTTLTVLRSQLAELEKQVDQQDGTTHARRKLVTVLFADGKLFCVLFKCLLNLERRMGCAFGIVFARSLGTP